MRYTAFLQRSDDAHVKVCDGDDRGEVVAAAREIYVALIPEIQNFGRSTINSEALGVRGVDSLNQEHAKNAKRWGWLVSEHLRAQEWGIGVYEMNEATESRGASVGEIVFWLGATRDDPET